MNKKILVLAAFFLLGNALNGFSQDSITFRFNEKLNNFSIGYDFKNLRKIKKVNEFGPLHLKYERAFSKNIGIGLASYLHLENNHVEQESVSFSNGEFVRYDTREFGFAFIPKINWHFNFSHFKNRSIHKFDIYVGAGIGYGFGRKRFNYLMKDEDIITYLGYQDNIDKNHYVATELNIGVRYFALKNFGAYVELGFGMSRAQLGLIYKW
jgi:hypothetical protein